MSDNVAKYTRITSNHVQGYRYGEWATLTGLKRVNNRKGGSVECYTLRFDDGVEDMWPVVDPWDDYRFE